MHRNEQGSQTQREHGAETASNGVDRRRFLTGMGAVGAGIGLGSLMAACSTTTDDHAPTTPAATSAKPTPFDGPYQTGIAEPPQPNALLIAYDLSPKEGETVPALRQRVQRLLTVWTEDARAFHLGQPVLADLEPEMVTADANLTITFGIAPALLERLDVHTAAHVPTWVREHLDGLPAFPGEAINPDESGGDLVLQLCADNATALAHVARHMTRAAQQFAQPRWSMRGFLGEGSGTPRNLFGFKDGTAQPDAQQMSSAVWDAFGGTSMVVRKVVFDLPAWEQLSTADRELAFGRHQDTGAPLGAADEFAAVDLSATDKTGLPYIDKHSHVGISAGEGTNMRRRGYNWDGDITADGESGLIFISFQHDPATFIRVQTKLAERDRMNTWMTHVATGLYWCPPGTGRAEKPSNWGREVLGAFNAE